MFVISSGARNLARMGVAKYIARIRERSFTSFRMTNKLVNFDYFLFQQLNNWAGRFFWLDAIGVFFAGHSQYFLAAAVLAFFLWQKNWGWKKRIFSAGITFFSALLARFVLVEIIRWFWFRPRPFVSHQIISLIFHENTGSFPSGNMAFFFALSAVVYVFNKKIGWLFFLGSFLMGLARIFVGVHYPLDILVGALVGIFSGWLVYYLFNFYQNKKAR